MKVLWTAYKHLDQSTEKGLEYLQDFVLPYIVLRLKRKTLRETPGPVLMPLVELST
jgi:hypothetical protein